MAVIDLDAPPSWWPQQASHHMTAQQARNMSSTAGLPSKGMGWWWCPAASVACRCSACPGSSATLMGRMMCPCCLSCCVADCCACLRSKPSAALAQWILARGLTPCSDCTALVLAAPTSVHLLSCSTHTELAGSQQHACCNKVSLSEPCQIATQQRIC